jgi:AhpD family alkylhydroperoxidase
MRTKLIRAFILALSIAPTTAFAEDKTEPASPGFDFPLDRKSMLSLLERSKSHAPRLPLPTPTEEDKKRTSTSSLGGGIVNNGLMRRHYLPESWNAALYAGLGGRQGTVDNAFKVELFWIASRLNRCAYCLGHQETKLTSAGLSEEAIASLDGDWKDADAATRAARRLTLWKTLTPHKPVPPEIMADLATRFDTKQVGEILLSIANYNAMNRWTGPLNIPQEGHRTYSDRSTESTGARRTALAEATKAAASTKRDLPDYGTWLKAVDAAANDQANSVEAFLKSQGPAGEGRLNSWMRAVRESTDEVAIPPLLRARIFWLSARLDNAPRAAAVAFASLKAQGETADSIRLVSEDSASDAIPVKERVVLALARKIALNPGSVGDDDIAAVRAHWGDRATAHIVETACIASAVDRL